MPLRVIDPDLVFVLFRKVDSDVKSRAGAAQIAVATPPFDRPVVTALDSGMSGS